MLTDRSQDGQDLKMRTVRKQSGATMLGVMIGISGLVAVLTLLLKLGPHYLDFQTMKSIFNALPSAQVHTMSKKDIYEALSKRFRVNSLRDFELKEIVAIERQKTGTVVSVAYERRENIVANVDAVLSFSEQYEFK
jgi:hypothetical protein